MPKKEFTVTEVMVLQEQTLKEVRAVGEHIPYILEKVKKIDKIEEDVSGIKEDIKIIKLSLTARAGVEQVDDHKIRIDKLEKKLA